MKVKRTNKTHWKKPKFALFFSQCESIVSFAQKKKEIFVITGKKVSQLLWTSWLTFQMLNFCIGAQFYSRLKKCSEIVHLKSNFCSVCFNFSLLLSWVTKNRKEIPHVFKTVMTMATMTVSKVLFSRWDAHTTHAWRIQKYCKSIAKQTHESNDFKWRIKIFNSFVSCVCVCSGWQKHAIYQRKKLENSFDIVQLKKIAVYKLSVIDHLCELNAIFFWQITKSHIMLPLSVP